MDWSELAGQVRENVLERLLRRGDILLDGQMNHALAPVISRAVETMTRDVHDTLNRLIRDIVARAVNEEITRLHAEGQTSLPRGIFMAWSLPPAWPDGHPAHHQPQVDTFRGLR